MTELVVKCSSDPETDFLRCFRSSDVKKVNIVVYNEVIERDQDLSRQAAIVLSLDDAKKLKEKLEEILS